MMCTSIRHDSESDFYDSCEAPDGYKYIKHVKNTIFNRRKIKWAKSLVLI
jgi:hypothetical protein